jgi:hypothetical protein
MRKWVREMVAQLHTKEMKYIWIRAAQGFSSGRGNCFSGRPLQHQSTLARPDRGFLLQVVLLPICSSFLEYTARTHSLVSCLCPPLSAIHVDTSVLRREKVNLSQKCTWKNGKHLALNKNNYTYDKTWFSPENRSQSWGIHKLRPNKIQTYSNINREVKKKTKKLQWNMQVIRQGESRSAFVAIT